MGDVVDHVFRVRYSETDQMGWVYHSHYLTWFEMGRTELLRDSGLTYRDLEDQGVFLAVVSLQIKYKRPARYDDRLVLETTLTEAGRVKISHGYELYRDGILLTEAASTIACLDGEGALQPLPEVLMSRVGG